MASLLPVFVGASKAYWFTANSESYGLLPMAVLFVKYTNTDGICPSSIAI